MTIPGQFLQQRRFAGIDVYTAPQDLDENHAVQADNLISHAGELITRPGFQGQFSSVVGGGTPRALTAIMPYVQADGSTKLFFVAGGASNGQLYSTTKGSTTNAAVSGTPANIASPNARMARAGKYGYLVDGTNALVRFDVASGAAVASGQNPPTAAPTVVLANTVIDNMASTSGWYTDTFSSSGTNLITSSQADLDASSTGDITPGTTLGNTWIAVGSTPSIFPADGTRGIPLSYAGIASHWMGIDDPSGGFATQSGAHALINPVLDSPNGARYGHQFFASFPIYTSDTRSLQGVSLTCCVYSDTAATSLIGAGVYDYVPQFNSQAPGQKVEHVFSFPNVGTEIRAFRIFVTGAADNVNAAQFDDWAGFIYVAGGQVAAIADGITLTASSAGMTLTHSEPTAAYWGKVGGIRLTHDYGSNQDWSKKSHLALNLSPAAGGLSLQQLKDAGLSLQLGFRPNASTTHTFTNVLKLADDGTSATVDISTVPVSVLSAFRYLEIVFLADLDVSSSTQALITIASITDAGNLSVATEDYTWVATEVNDAGDATLVNVIESDSSPTSAALTPTVLLAQADVTLPVPVNGGNTTHYRVYEYGGVFPQGDTYPTGRLIATVAVGSDSSSGADGYWSWNHTTRTLRVNMPDSQIIYANTLVTDRGQPPTGAQAVAEWQNRLALAKGSTLHLSFLLTENASNGLYFNTIVDPADPNLKIKGGQFSVGGADNDPIQRLVPLGPMLIIIKTNSVYMLTGTDGTNFELSGHLQQTGVGCVAPLATSLLENRLWFLNTDGVWEYNGGEQIQPVSVEIEPLLAPAVFGGTAIPAIYYNRAAMVYAGRRLYLFAPGSSASTSNDTCYVYDTRVSGWVRWKNLPASINCGCTTATASDTGEIWCGGSDGQLYQITGNGDKLLSGSTATAVPFTFLSRGMGQEDTGPSYWTQNIAAAAYAAVKTNETAALTFSVRAADCPAVWSKVYNLAPQTRPPRFSFVTPDVRGDYVQVGVSGSTITQTKITSIAVEIAEGNPTS